MHTGCHTLSCACCHRLPNGYFHASSFAYGHTFTNSYRDTTAHCHSYPDACPEQGRRANASPLTDLDTHCHCRIHGQCGPVKCYCGWDRFIHFTARIGTHRRGTGRPDPTNRGWHLWAGAPGGYGVRCLPAHWA
jgi:hypothetical protein